jgi:hypothetical protein
MDLPWAWPRDGRRETLEGAGQALAGQYRREGLQLLSQHAQFEPTGIDKVGSVSVEAGLMEMLQRMEAAVSMCSGICMIGSRNFGSITARDGKVRKEGDDLMATRYAIMMLRYARTSIPSKPRKMICAFWTVKSQRTPTPFSRPRTTPLMEPRPAARSPTYIRAVLVSIGCSVALRQAPRAFTARMMS